MASVLRELDPDVVALQEVALGSVDGVVVDQPALFGQATGLEYRYGAVSHYQLSEPESGRAIGAMLWGNAVLSRHPIRGSRTHALPVASDDELVEPAGSRSALAGVAYRNAPGGAREPRCALACRIEIGSSTLTFLSTHLTHIGSSQRLRQAERLRGLVEEAHGPVVLAGDLNAPIDAPALHPLESLLDAFAAEGVPAGDPRRRSCGPYAIDHVLSRGAEALACRVFTEAGDLSDHWPVVARLAL
jgi:endonuclease/exonuclease/phosphatase family metal-dependent hydrolase